MPDTAQHLLGRLVDGRFPLRKLLGVSPNSAVFLTSIDPERPGDPARDAALKLIPEDPDGAAVLLERWQAAAELSHTGLLKIIQFGRCVIDGSPCLFVVTELADEDLGQLLPQRALTPDETRGMLAPVLAALDFLHEKGLVHAGLKPSNVHAMRDNVKLSPDRIMPAGESNSSWPLAAPFVAPESVLFPAADIWSLGATLCQTMTQSLPARGDGNVMTMPELPAPFAEIVRTALADDPTERISLDSVRALLDPNFVPRSRPEEKKVAAPAPIAAQESESPEALIEALQTTTAQASAAAAASSSLGARVATRASLPEVDPLSVPLSPVEPPSKRVSKPNQSAPRAPIPVSSLPQVNATIAGPRRVPAEKPAGERSNKLFLAAAVAAVLLAIVVVPRLLLRSSNSSNRPAQSPAPEASTASVPPSTTLTSPSAAQPEPKASTTTRTTAPADSSVTASKEKAAVTVGRNTRAENPAVNSVAPVPSTAPVKSEPAKSNPAAPTVIRKILPEVSEKARSTISGTVRINVKVQLNGDGTVSSAELNSPAVSQFFADLALKAARQWQFGPPASTDGSAPEAALSSAVIRFDFTQTGTAAYLP